MLEKAIEKKIKDYIEAREGLFIKVTSPSFTGLPDRLMVLPDGRMIFVEIKAPGGRLSARQKRVIEILKSKNVTTWVVNNLESFCKLYEIYLTQIKYRGNVNW